MLLGYWLADGSWTLGRKVVFAVMIIIIKVCNCGKKPTTRSLCCGKIHRVLVHTLLAEPQHHSALWTSLLHSRTSCYASTTCVPRFFEAIFSLYDMISTIQGALFQQCEWHIWPQLSAAEKLAFLIRGMLKERVWPDVFLPYKKLLGAWSLFHYS